MATPKIVQRQLAQAEALAAQASEQANAAAPTNVVTDASQLLMEAPVPAQTAAPPAPPTPQPAPAVSQDDWEKKYRSLQGMYNAEVPSLRAQTKAQESELASMKDQIKALQAAVATKAPPEPPKIDPRDVESFGAEMIEMVQRYAAQTFEGLRNEFGSAAEQLNSRLQKVEEAITGVSTKTEATLEQQFYSTLTQMVPDWEAINGSEEWLSWLDEVDPIYGVSRQVALTNAHKRGDVARVAATFNQFKTTRPARPSAALAAQQSPSGTGAGAVSAPAPQTQQLISSKFVNTFYADQFKGRYKGREDEAKRIEAMINQAAAEGRIVP